jgi:hypothetical protein
MNIGSLFVNLGFKADTKALKNFDNGIKNLNKNIALTTGAVLASTYAFKKFLDTGVNVASGLVNFQNQTGLAVDGLNKLVAAGTAVSTGLSFDNITNDVINLEKTLARIRLGQGSVKPFQLLNIDVNGQNAFGVIEQLRKQIKGLPDITATILLEDVGLNANFLQILKLSDEQFNRLGKNNFLSGGQARSINQLGINFNKLGMAFVNLKNQGIAKVTPALNDLINKGLKFLSANGKEISNIISNIAGAFIKFAEAVGRVGFLIGNFVSNFRGLDGALKYIGIAFAGITLAMRPLLLGLTAVFLVLEDIAVWKMGGLSAFGGLYDALSKLPNIDKILGFGAASVALITLTGGVAKFGGALTGVLTKLAPLTGALTGLYALGELFKSFTGFSLTPTSTEDFKGNADAAKNAGLKITDFLTDALKPIASLITEKGFFGKDKINNSVNNNTNTYGGQNNNINITINAEIDDKANLEESLKKIIDEKLDDRLIPVVNNLNYQI